MSPQLWDRLLRTGKIAGVVVAITGAIVGVATAWPLIEPYMAAHRAYVRAVAMGLTDSYQAAQSDSRRVIRDLQIEQAEGKRDSATDAIVKWTIEIRKSNDETTKSMIQGQIDQLLMTKRRLNEQIDTLNKTRFQ